MISWLIARCNWWTVPKTLSVHSLVQAHRFGSCLVSTGTTNDWSAGPGMPLLLQRLMPFHNTARTMACFLHFPDLHDPNVPSSLQHGVQAAINLSLQPHHFHPCSQGPMYLVITVKLEIQRILMGMTGNCWIFQAEELQCRHTTFGQ
jgi:hypothetical protein